MHFPCVFHINYVYLSTKGKPKKSYFFGTFLIFKIVAYEKYIQKLQPPKP